MLMIYDVGTHCMIYVIQMQSVTEETNITIGIFSQYMICKHMSRGSLPLEILSLK